MLSRSCPLLRASRKPDEILHFVRLAWPMREAMKILKHKRAIPPSSCPLAFNEQYMRPQRTANTAALYVMSRSKQLPAHPLGPPCRPLRLHCPNFSSRRLRTAALKVMMSRYRRNLKQLTKTCRLQLPVADSRKLRGQQTPIAAFRKHRTARQIFPLAASRKHRNAALYDMVSREREQQTH